MDHYNQSKKARRITSIIYLLILSFIVGGTYLSEQQKQAAKNAAQNTSISTNDAQ